MSAQTPFEQAINTIAQEAIDDLKKMANEITDSSTDEMVRDWASQNSDVLEEWIDEHVSYKILQHVRGILN